MNLTVAPVANSSITPSTTSLTTLTTASSVMSPTTLPAGISELNLIIISVVLSVVVVILLVILGLVIRMRRKRRETIAGRMKLTGTPSSAAQSHLQDEEDPETLAAYQDPGLIHNIATSWPDQLTIPANMVNLRRPANLEVTESGSTPGSADYENGHIVTQRATSPTSPGSKPLTPQPRNIAFALPPRRHVEKRSVSSEFKCEDETDLSSVIEKRASNLFREGTKLYHHYVNAARHDYEIPRDRIATKEILGKGHFGNVYYGKLMDQHGEATERVAIKTMRKSATDTDKNEFIYEFEIMKLINTLRHPNLIQMIGSITKSEPYMILLELMPNGNLRQFLRDSRCSNEYYNLHANSRVMSERQLLQFALDIARGMEGIAELQLLHRDLAARNILLDKDFNCKIADFGFAKDVLNKPEYKCKSVFQRPRPTRWLPPESLIYYKHSIQSDVWSYGIVLWEIVTLGNLPYPFIKDSAKVVTALSKGLRMKQPKHCSQVIFNVMKICWEERPEDRPTFSQLVDRVEQLLDKAEKREVLRHDDESDDDDYVHELPDHSAEIFTNFIGNETLD